MLLALDGQLIDASVRLREALQSPNDQPINDFFTPGVSTVVFPFESNDFSAIRDTTALFIYGTSGLLHKITVAASMGRIDSFSTISLKQQLLQIPHLRARCQLHVVVDAVPVSFL
jgi:hypothetical protein